MPPPSIAIHRYEIIDRLLTNGFKEYPTMHDLKRAIDRELKTNVSKETIQKDISHMKLSLEDGGYGAPIKFKKSVNGYYYDFVKFPDYTIRKFGLSQKSLEVIEIAAGVLKRFKGIMASDSFNQTLNHLYASLNIERTSKESNLANAIMPEDTTYLRGMENFDILVESIKNKLPISFVHYSYGSREFKTAIVHPYLLKESNNRWYLVGYSESKEHKENPIRNFGVDRIYDPVLLDKEFIEYKGVGLKEMFQNKIGLNTLKGINETQTENIELWVSAKMSNYFKSMPIHKSQQITERGQGDIIVTLQLVPTHELVSLILSYGTQVELLGPEWLRKKLEKEYQATYSFYKDSK